MQCQWFYFQGKDSPLSNPSDIKGMDKPQVIEEIRPFDVFIHTYYPAGTDQSKHHTTQLWVWEPLRSSGSPNSCGWKPVVVGYVQACFHGEQTQLKGMSKVDRAGRASAVQFKEITLRKVNCVALEADKEDRKIMRRLQNRDRNRKSARSDGSNGGVCSAFPFLAATSPHRQHSHYCSAPPFTYFKLFAYGHSVYPHGTPHEQLRLAIYMGPLSASRPSDSWRLSSNALYLPLRCRPLMTIRPPPPTAIADVQCGKPQSSPSVDGQPQLHHSGVSQSGKRNAGQGGSDKPVPTQVTAVFIPLSEGRRLSSGALYLPLHCRPLMTIRLPPPTTIADGCVVCCAKVTALAYAIAWSLASLTLGLNLSPSSGPLSSAFDVAFDFDDTSINAWVIRVHFQRSTNTNAALQPHNVGAHASTVTTGPTSVYYLTRL
ncbi:hypothetical protein EDB85DRAFT_1898193 [Lactarius pseudohatsudake]|nr:hypothetical protein EDB85DRAFT_1898193 [Lactarius pseudohatsudake]